MPKDERPFKDPHTKTTNDPEFQAFMDAVFPWFYPDRGDWRTALSAGEKRMYAKRYNWGRLYGRSGATLRRIFDAPDRWMPEFPQENDKKK